MATTQISDVIVPEVFFAYIREAEDNVNRLVQSGAVVVDPRVEAFLGGGGATMNVPSWKPTEGDAENVSTDDPTDVATANKLTTGNQIAHRLDRNNAWSSADLTAHFAGSDPMAAAAAYAAGERLSKRQTALVNVLNGLFDTVAPGPLSASHLNDIAEKTTAGSAAVATSIGAGAVIDTLSAFGDSQGSGMLLAVHSDTHRLLQKQNLIDFQPSNVQDIGWGTYLGFTLLVDDGMPKTVFDTTGLWYRSYILKPASVTVTVGTPRVPVEVEREALQGEGGGIETLVVRDAYVAHVYGTAWTGTPAGLTPTNAELADGDNWDQVFSDKMIGAVALDHNNIAA